MKHSRTFRLALSRGLLGSALLASPAFALSSAEIDSLRAKADRGNVVAQYNLGLAYADRQESIYNPAHAYAWLSLASANGANTKELATLTGSLTPAQLAEGKRLLASLSPDASPISAAVSPIVTPTASSPSQSAVVSVSAPVPASVVDTDADQKKLSSELAAAWKENELLKAGLTAQLADARKRVAIAEAALASKDKEIAALQARAAEASAAPANADALASLRAEHAQLKSAAAAAELAALRESSAKASADQSALREKLARATTSLNEALRAQSIAESEAAALKAAADRASAERLAATAQLEAVTAELEKAKAAPADTINPLAERVKSLEAERDSLTAQLAAAQAVLPVAPAAEVVTAPIPAVPEPPVAPDAASADRVAELEQAKAETDTKLEAALRSFTLQQAEIDRLQKSLASIDEERAATATKLEAALAELTTVRPQAAREPALVSEIETLRTQLADARQTISEQGSALSASNQSLADARKTIDTATAELVATRDQLRQTQAQSAASAIEAQQLKTRLALVGNLPAANSPSRPGAIPAISVSVPAVTTASAQPETPAVSRPAPAPRIHTVTSGDSLSRISKQYYGTPNRWNDILQANKDIIRNPDALALGTRIRIP